ncbi:MAG: hypothetical protein DRJ50_01990, partial [Actinobacteria bacterium]
MRVAPPDKCFKRFVRVDTENRLARNVVQFGSSGSVACFCDQRTQRVQHRLILVAESPQEFDDFHAVRVVVYLAQLLEQRICKWRPPGLAPPGAQLGPGGSKQGLTRFVCRGPARHLLPAIPLVPQHDAQQEASRQVEQQQQRAESTPRAKDEDEGQDHHAVQVGLQTDHHPGLLKSRPPPTDHEDDDRGHGAGQQQM